jgi:hypothetical protein
MADEQVTVDNVDKLKGPLTEDTVVRVLDLYDSPYPRKEVAHTLIEVFTNAGLSAWTGLAIMKKESSFANYFNNPDIDERNKAQPFGAHFVEPEKHFSKDCARNALLKPDPQGEFKGIFAFACSVKGFRLPTFRESVERCVWKLQRGGVEKYNPIDPTYKEKINGMLRDILNRLAKDGARKK